MSQVPSRLHEVSVVVALRDWQWESRDTKEFPNLGVNLAGRPEKKLGDTIIRDGERLYLFEVKSTRATIPEEWATIWGKRKDKAKHAHLVLAAELVEFGTYGRFPFETLNGDASAPHLYRSLACHFFAFWPTEADMPEPFEDRVWVDSYLLASLKEHGFLADDTMKNGLIELGQYDLAASLSPLSQADSDDIVYRTMSFGTLDMIHDHSARIVGTSKQGTEPVTKWCHVGLELEEFQKYVDFLCKGADEEINAVIMSSKGSVFAHSARTSDLKSMVDAFQSGSKATSSPKREASRRVGKVAKVAKVAKVDKTQRQGTATSTYSAAEPTSDLGRSVDFS